MLVQNVICNVGLKSMVKPIAASNVLLNHSQVRHRQAVWFRKYQQPMEKKKMLLSVCEPFQAIDRREPVEKCFNLKPLPPRPEHPLDLLEAKEMLEETENSSLVCFFHMNSITNREKRPFKNEFTKAGMSMHLYNKNVARLAWAGTRYEVLAKTFTAGYFFPVVFSPTTDNIPKIIQITKKYTGIYLLGAMIDKRRMLTLKQLEEVGKMANLDSQRAMLCHTLNVSQQGLLQTLSYQTTQLSQLLKSHANQGEETTTSSESSSDSSSSSDSE